MEGTGITLLPPGDAVPSISSDDAYALCLNGVAACAPFLSPTAINLALATDTHSGEVDANGNLHLTLPRTLVWAISWIGISRCASTPGGFSLPTPSPSGSVLPSHTIQPLCDVIAFVDAKSGKFYFTESAAHQ
jgi:hypothetical protein